MKKTKNNRRGFIGPLGDDIPSIFPIIGGILLFIGSIAYVSNLFDTKNMEISKRKAALDMSYQLTDKGYLDTIELSNRCTNLNDFAQKRGIKYVAVLQKHCNEMYLAESNFKDSDGIYRSVSPPPKNNIFDIKYPANAAAGSGSQPYSALIAKSGVTPGNLEGGWCQNTGGTTPAAIDQIINDNFAAATSLTYPVATDCQGRRGFGMINILVWREKKG